MIPEHRRLVDSLVESRKLAPEWVAAFERVPRHLFVPDRFWDREEHDWFQRERIADPRTWLMRAYADEPIVVQIDDGSEFPDVTNPCFTSSAPMPTNVAVLLGQLDVHPDHRVLELGTGTGFVTALLAERVGAHNVTSVEADSLLAEHARTTLRRGGWDVPVVTRDGTLGWSTGAPYDRVAATYTVRRVPYAWVEQCVDGGAIVTPWGTPYTSTFLLRLSVRDGVATGRFTASAAFMWDRVQRPRSRPMDEFTDQYARAESGRTALHPREVAPGSPAGLAVGLRVPRCQWSWEERDAVGGGALWLYDDAGSWASVAVAATEADGYEFREYGPRRLWREVVEAHDWWQSRGRPGPHRFGATVAAEEQTVWLDTPDNRVDR